MLALVFLAVVAPIVPAAMTRHIGWVEATAMAVSATGAAYGWVRHRSFRRPDAAMVTVLAAIAAAAQPLFGVWTLLGGLCAASLLRARGIAMPWLSWNSRRCWTGVVVAVPVGLALAVLNVFLARRSGSGVGGSMAGPAIVLNAVKAGVSEELGMRLCLLALCVYVLGRLPRTAGERALTYFVLVAPHAALHYVQHPGQMVGGTIVLGVLFGLPLTFLIRRFGVLPAATAHAVMDSSRFLILGA